MKPSDYNRLEHIKIYCDEIAATVARFGADLDTFLADKDYQASVSMRLLNIGELAKGLSAGFREETGDLLPWKLITGLRDHVAHGYHQLEFAVVFNTAIQDIPHLAEVCQKLMESSGKVS